MLARRWTTVLAFACLVLVATPAAGSHAAPVDATTESPPVAGAAPAGVDAGSAADDVTVTLTVTEADGTPAAGDAVVWRNAVTGAEVVGTTDASGTVTVTLQASTGYRVSYRQNGSGPPADDGSPDAYALGTVSYGGDVTRSTTLPPAHDLTVSVANGSGTPVPNATAFAVHQAGAGAVTGPVEVDADGDATFEVVGTVQASAKPPGDASLGENHTHVRVDGPTDVTLTLRETVRFDGSVAAPDGDRLANATLRLRSLGPTGGFQQHVTDEEGTFGTRVVRNASYATPLWQANLRTAPTAFPRDGVADFHLPGVLNATGNRTENYSLPVGHVLNVTVVDASGDPVQDAVVSIGRTDDGVHANFYSHRHQAGPATDAQGRMVHGPNGVPGVELNGSYHLHVRPPDGSGYAPTGTDVTVTSDRHLTVVLHDEGGGDPARVTVSGTVRDPDGDVVPNATVRVANRGGPSDERVAVTNASGRYSLAVQPDRPYKVGVYQANLSAEAPAFPRDGVADFANRGMLTAGGPTTRNLTLPAGHPVNVTVENASGSPVTDAGVRFHVRNGSQGMHVDPGDRRFPVNADGLLAHPPNDLPGLELAGPAQVTALPASAAHLRNRTRVDVAGPTDATLTLHRAVNVSGTVFHPDGTPAADATISWERTNGPGHAPHDVTDDQGRYDLRVAANVSYDKQVRPVDHRDPPYVYPRDGVADAVSFRPTTETGDVTRNYTIPVGHPFNVTVVDESGAPVEDAVVRASHRNGSANARLDGFIHGVPTNARGLMEHEPNGLPGFEMNGTVGVAVEPPAGTGYGGNATTVNVTGPTNATVVLPGSGSVVNVSGTVTYPDGSAAGDVTLRWLADDDGAQAVTAADGSFDATLQPNASYRVVGWQADLRNANGEAPTELAYPRDGVADFAALGWLNTSTADVSPSYSLPGGHALNVTVENASGEPIEDASVRLTHRADGVAAGFYGYLHADGVPTDAAGRMAHPPNPRPGLEVAGTVELSVRPPDGADYGQNGTTVTVDEPTNRTVVLGTGGDGTPLSGRWLTPGGDPVAGAQVVAFRFSPTPEFETATTDADGRFGMGVDGGSYTVQVLPQTPGDGVVDVWALDSVSVSGPTDLGDVTLPRGYATTLNVTGVDGRPVDAFLDVAAGNGSWYHQFHHGRSLATPDGYDARTRDLPNGSYSPTVRDAWTHDVLGEPGFSVAGTNRTVTLGVDRYAGTRVPGTPGLAVVRDLQAPFRDRTAQDLLNTSVNVRLFVPNATAGTHAHVHEAFPDGYGLNGTVADVTADGPGGIENVTDEGGALSFDVVGDVTEVRYRVSPNGTPAGSGRFGGHFGTNGTPILGEDSLPAAANVSVFAPENGTTTGPNATVEAVTRHPDAANATAVEYRLDGDDWQSVPSTPPVFSIDLAYLAAGDHTVTVRLVADDGSVVATDAVSFTVDAGG